MNPHRHGAYDDECPACEHLAESRADDRDDPMSAGEEQERDNAYEAAMDRSWG